jgi:hypothetical protein
MPVGSAESIKNELIAQGAHTTALARQSENARVSLTE